MIFRLNFVHPHLKLIRPYLSSAILGIASQYPDLKSIAVKVVTSIFPTSVELVDVKLLERLLRHVKPDEPIAEIIVKQTAWYLAHYNRDRYNQYEFSDRAMMLEWLHQMPENVYRRFKSDLFEVGKQVAERDSWESCFFASLFAQHSDHDLEGAILNIAANSLMGEKRYQEFRKKLKELQLIAAINVELVNGNLSSAQQLLSEITELES
jgi:hypothetical protein